MVAIYIQQKYDAVDDTQRSLNATARKQQMSGGFRGLYSPTDDASAPKGSLLMSEEHALVIVAGYQDLDSARRDFDTLTERTKGKQISLRGAVLVGKDAEGNPLLVDTGNRLGRRGAAWGAGAGLAVGLFSPALLASAAVGAAAGALAGTFADHRIKSGLADKIGQALAAGSGVVIAVVPPQGRLATEQALAGSPMKSVAELSQFDAAKPGCGPGRGDGQVQPGPHQAAAAATRFGGTIGRTMAESVGDWTIVPGPKAPDGAPNVLIVLIDDAGFGGPDTFGGAIRTPTLTRVAQNGLTYNRFHVTAVCSPTRAALLTGRNHHRVGFGSVCEFPGPFPGYSSVKPQSCAALPRILRDNGYVTGGFGKWHLTPDNVQGAAGPFDNWPLGWGFDHFWGFLSGAAGQYDPIITQDNSVIGVPQGRNGKPYYFPDDLTDKAVEWLHGVRAQDAEKPWMMYYSTGATHAPHHVFAEWADKYSGQFDEGWDVYRRKTFERQKELGVIPPDTELTERPDLFPAWDSLSEDQKKLYARQMEVFAGFSENADFNVGRLLDAIEDLGESDNTLVFYIWGDNGASMEGTLTGSFNEMTFLNGVVLDAEQQLQLIEQYGGIEALGNEHTAPHFASAWAHANNTPFQWGKQMASHLGGARDPMVVAWPSRIRPDTRVRSSSPTASTSCRRCWRPSAYPSRLTSTASSRRPWTGPASCTPSTSRPPPRNVIPCSTSRCSAAAPSTGTGGGRAPAWTRRPGTCPRRRCSGSRPESTTPTTTSGSCTTCPTTSPRPRTWRPSTPTRSRSSPSCGGPKPNATGCCRCSAAWR